MPSQKMTYTNVGAKFRSDVVVPKSAVARVSPKRRPRRARARSAPAARARRAEPAGKRLPLRVLLEERAAPESEEKDERDDEDERRPT
jgi:hypothetical protein